jgi:pilus assembly protein FimV
MKRKYVFAGLGLIAVLAIVSPAAGGPSLKSLVKKEVTKQLAGKTGPAGPQGAAGTPGAAGAPGAPGTPGRSALTPLQPGETEFGALGGDFDTAAGGDWAVSASYSIPLTTAIGNAFVDGSTGETACTGTFTAPTAPSNTLCVYPTNGINPSLGGTTHQIVTTANSRFGFAVVWTASVAGDTLFRGVYAVKQ